MYHSWFRRFAGKNVSTQLSRGYRPQLEPLEDRKLLSFLPAVNYPNGTGDLTTTVAVGNLRSNGIYDIVMNNEPGDYRVSGWSHGAVTKPLGEGSALARPFHVDAGQIVFLGNFDATFRTSTLGNTEYREWSITPMAFRADEVVTSVRGAYPAFADVPITCLFCDPPAEDAAIFALPARAPADGTLGKSSAVLHYRRHAGYDGWALFAWETFQEPEDLLAPGDDGSGRLVRDGSWKRSLAPDGTDAFGIYWRLDEADFRNGRVNLLVRSQSATEGRPRFWLLRDSHEAWINEGDPTVYLSRAQAEAAWKP